MTRPWLAVAAAAVGVIVLSGCAADAQPGPATSPVTATPPSPSPSSAPPLTRTPQTPTQQPEEVDVGDVRMPFALEESVVVDPGWTASPHELDGVLIAPVEHDALVEFAAVSTAGEALWSAQRPLDAAGYAVTLTSQDQPLAVLTDIAEPSAGRTASAYDLATGALVWGPVDVPGPLVGPGVVFAATEATTTADAGSPVALDPDTGAEVSWGGGATWVLGEFAGEVLVETQGELVLRRTSDDAVVWNVSDVNTDTGAPLTATGDLRGGLVMLKTGSESSTVLRLDSGRVIAEGIIDAVLDPTTSTVVVTHEEGLRALDAHGEPLWAYPTAQDAVLHSAHGALVYTREGATMRVHNAVTGAVALAYQDSGTTIAVPEHFSASGAAVISVDGRILLATAG